ncbi:MAG: 3-dehydroquinate synthase [Fretibacterium sp.]|nr:3-dehydroquinate synthase [Fretibacterium sp.]
MRTQRVNVGKGYDVKIGKGLLTQCGGEVAGVLGPCSIAVVTDANVGGLYLERCLTSFEEAGIRATAFTFPAGEGAKTLSTLSDILEALASSGLTRADGVVALGGGVTGDMAGFAAGCYMRGVRFVQLPTTLLAAVDSSVGGKTAVDLRAGKNLAGLFHQPSLVLCDTDCLNTLPEAEYQCGLAEALKTGVLSGEGLFRLFEEGTARQYTEEIIAHCVEYKAGVVERDEKERGERKLLNLGHTVGHAIELCSGYTILHGLAVAAGLAVIARASARLGWSAPATALRIEGALKKSSLPITTNYSPSELSKAALSDKKREMNNITLAIPCEIGACALRTVGVGELEGIIAAGLPPLEGAR